MRNFFQIAASTSMHESSDASTASCTIAPSNGGKINEDDEASQAKKTSMKKASDFTWKKEIRNPPNVDFTGRFSSLQKRYLHTNTSSNLLIASEQKLVKTEN